jgi:5-hydroxyisourate hydrolase
MPGISIHVVDVSRGVVAAGMRVELYRRDTRLVEGTIGANGLLEHPALKQRFVADNYQAVFHVADYYRGAGIALPARPFLHVVRYDFGIADAEQHYHLPFKCTPWGYSCFRGGA